MLNPAHDPVAAMKLSRYWVQSSSSGSVSCSSSGTLHLWIAERDPFAVGAARVEERRHGQPLLADDRLLDAELAGGREHTRVEPLQVVHVGVGIAHVRELRDQGVDRRVGRSLLDRDDLTAELLAAGRDGVRDLRREVGAVVDRGDRCAPSWFTA